MLDFRAQQRRNRARTIALLIAMFAVLTTGVWAVCYIQGVGGAFLVPIAVGIALAGTWSSYWCSDRLVLAMTGARVLSPVEHPQLNNLVEEVALAAGLPMPRIAIVSDSAPNAFATGRDPQHAVVGFTTGILDRMDREQLQGVVAHELAHVANRDTLVAAVAATTAGLLAILSDLGLRMMSFSTRSRSKETAIPILLLALVALVLAPIAALLLQATISRKRESLADATAVQFTRNPAGLRRALQVLDADSTVVRRRSNAVAHLWIESPLDRRKRSLFATHPPMDDRIHALRAMEGGPSAIGARSSR